MREQIEEASVVEVSVGVERGEQERRGDPWCPGVFSVPLPEVQNNSGMRRQMISGGGVGVVAVSCEPHLCQQLHTLVLLEEGVRGLETSQNHHCDKHDSQTPPCRSLSPQTPF